METEKGEGGPVRAGEGGAEAQGKASGVLGQWPAEGLLRRGSLGEGHPLGAVNVEGL